jgi:hypothetical protein
MLPGGSSRPEQFSEIAHIEEAATDSSSEEDNVPQRQLAAAQPPGILKKSSARPLCRLRGSYLSIDDLLRLQGEIWNDFESLLSRTNSTDILAKFLEVKESSCENLQGISSLFCLSESARFSAEQRSAKYVIQLGILQRKYSTDPPNVSSATNRSSFWFLRYEKESQSRTLSKYLKLWER